MLLLYGRSKGDGGGDAESSGVLSIIGIDGAYWPSIL